MSVGFMARLDAAVAGAGIIASAGSATAESGAMALGVRRARAKRPTRRVRGKRGEGEPGRRRLLARQRHVTALRRLEPYGGERRGITPGRLVAAAGLDAITACPESCCNSKTTGPRSLQIDAQAFLHLGAEPAAHRHRGAVAQEDLEVAVRRGLEL